MTGRIKKIVRGERRKGVKAPMRSGFTLIEAMLAGAILAIGCLGVLSILLAVIQQNAVSQRRTEGMYVAELLLSRLEALDAQGNRSTPPLSTIIAQDQGAWMPLIEKGQNRYQADGNVDANGAFFAHYMVLVDDAGSVVRYPDFVRGALRVAWTKPRGAQACAFEDGNLKGNCDSVSLPFVFRH